MDDTKLLNETETARFLNLKPKTLARWRWSGKGPVFRKIGGAVRYSLFDLEAYLEASKRNSTSDPGQEAA